MSQAQQFFEALYANQTGILELRAFGHEKSDDLAAEAQRKAASKLRDFVPVIEGKLDIARVNIFLQGCEKNRLGAYFGVALRTESAIIDKKGDGAHCKVLTALFVDADFKHLGEAETRRRITEFPLVPSMVVASGGGLHSYWILSDPLLLQVGMEMEAAKLILRNLASKVADVVDESVSEPVRVLRIPGGFNFKKEYGEPRAVVLE